MARKSNKRGYGSTSPIKLCHRCLKEFDSLVVDECPNPECRKANLAQYTTEREKRYDGRANDEETREAK